jgi:hypothetical protein
MYSSNEKISNILKVKSEEINIKCELDKWYISILNKTIEELNVNDVYRMLRQDILIEIAVDKAIKILEENPLEGEMYDGQLLELLYSLHINKYKEYIPKVKDLLIKINSNISSFEWMCDDDFKEYLDVMKRYLEKLC